VAFPGAHNRGDLGTSSEGGTCCVFRLTHAFALSFVGHTRSGGARFVAVASWDLRLLLRFCFGDAIPANAARRRRRQFVAVAALRAHGSSQVILGALSCVLLCNYRWCEPPGNLIGVPRPGLFQAVLKPFLIHNRGLVLRQRKLVFRVVQQRIFWTPLVRFVPEIHH
jgi:hypothetical protein